METIDNEINESRRLEAIQDMNYFISLMTPEIFQDQIKVQYKGYSGEKSLSTNIKTMSVCLSTDEMFFYTPEGLFVCRQIFHPRKFCFWDYERAKEYLNECSIEYLLERFNDNIKDNKFCLGYSIVLNCQISDFFATYFILYLKDSKIEIKSGYCTRDNNNNRISDPYWDHNPESNKKYPGNFFLYTVCNTQYLLEKRPY